MSKSTNTLNTPSNDASGTDKMTTLQVRGVIISYKIILKLTVKEQMVFILKELNLGDR